MSLKRIIFLNLEGVTTNILWPDTELYRDFEVLDDIRMHLDPRNVEVLNRLTDMTNAELVVIDPVFRNFSVYGANQILSQAGVKAPVVGKRIIEIENPWKIKRYTLSQYADTLIDHWLNWAPNYGIQVHKYIILHPQVGEKISPESGLLHGMVPELTRKLNGYD